MSLDEINDCPRFYPTNEEFANPLQYIEKIRPQVAEHYGICIIHPPSSWNSEFALNEKKISFQTRLQHLQQLQAREYERQKERLGNWLNSRSIPHVITSFSGNQVNLHDLLVAVQTVGGPSMNKNWNNIAKRLNIEVSDLNIQFLRNAYNRYLQLFLAQQIPIHSKSTKAQFKTTYDNNNENNNNDNKILGDWQILQAPSGGTYYFNYKTGVTQWEVPYGSSVEDAPLWKEFTTKDGRKKYYFNTVSKETVWTKPINFGVKVSVDKPEPNRNTYAMILSNNDIDNNNSHNHEKNRHHHRRDHDENIVDVGNLICSHCQGGHREDKLIICDGCDVGFHLFCLSPPLKSVPTSKLWFCPECKSVQSQAYGFAVGKKYTLEEFHQRADNFKRNWAKVYKGITNETIKADELLSVKEIEEYFWDIISSNISTDEDITVEYGADLDTLQLGSGFSNDSDWNLNKFAHLGSSVLSHLDDVVSGITHPWLYIGMMFSAFCWHNEDHYLPSISYLHTGAPKIWYGVPGLASTKMEKAMRDLLPELFRTQPDLLFQLVTIVHPTLLQSKGVPICRAIQNPGEFIVTFPAAFHAGFNAGFNVAEAVNFGPPYWIPYGLPCTKRYSLYRHAPVFSYSELIINLARTSSDVSHLQWIIEPLKEILEKTELGLMNLLSNGVGFGIRWIDHRLKNDTYEGRMRMMLVNHNSDDNNNNNNKVQTSPKQCIICRSQPYLVAICCSKKGCSDNKIACMDHWNELCNCPANRKYFKYRYSLKELHQCLKRADQLVNPINNIHVKESKTIINDYDLDGTQFTPNKETSQYLKPNILSIYSKELWIKQGRSWLDDCTQVLLNNECANEDQNVIPEVLHRWRLTWLLLHGRCFVWGDETFKNIEQKYEEVWKMYKLLKNVTIATGIAYKIELPPRCFVEKWFADLPGSNASDSNAQQPLYSVKSTDAIKEENCPFSIILENENIDEVNLRFTVKKVEELIKEAVESALDFEKQLDIIREKVVRTNQIEQSIQKTLRMHGVGPDLLYMADENRTEKQLFEIHIWNHIMNLLNQCDYEIEIEKWILGLNKRINDWYNRYNHFQKKRNNGNPVVYPSSNVLRCLYLHSMQLSDVLKNNILIPRIKYKDLLQLREEAQELPIILTQEINIINEYIEMAENIFQRVHRLNNNFTYTEMCLAIKYILKLEQQYRVTIRAECIIELEERLKPFQEWENEYASVLTKVCNNFNYANSNDNDIKNENKDLSIDTMNHSKFLDIICSKDDVTKLYEKLLNLQKQFYSNKNFFNFAEEFPSILTLEYRIKCLKWLIEARRLLTFIRTTNASQNYTKSLTYLREIVERGKCICMTEGLIQWHSADTPDMIISSHWKMSKFRLCTDYLQKTKQANADISEEYTITLLQIHSLMKPSYVKTAKLMERIEANCLLMPAQYDSLCEKLNIAREWKLRCDHFLKPKQFDYDSRDLLPRLHETLTIDQIESMINYFIQEAERLPFEMDDLHLLTDWLNEAKRFHTSLKDEIGNLCEELNYIVSKDVIQQIIPGINDAEYFAKVQNSVILSGDNISICYQFITKLVNKLITFLDQLNSGKVETIASMNIRLILWDAIVISNFLEFIRKRWKRLGMLRGECDPILLHRKFSEFQDLDEWNSKTFNKLLDAYDEMYEWCQSVSHNVNNTNNQMSIDLNNTNNNNNGFNNIRLSTDPQVLQLIKSCSINYKSIENRIASILSNNNENRRSILVNSEILKQHLNRPFIINMNVKETKNLIKGIEMAPIDFDANILQILNVACNEAIQWIEKLPLNTLNKVTDLVNQIHNDTFKKVEIVHEEKDVVSIEKLESLLEEGKKLRFERHQVPEYNKIQQWIDAGSILYSKFSRIIAPGFICGPAIFTLKYLLGYDPFQQTYRDVELLHSVVPPKKVPKDDVIDDDLHECMCLRPNGDSNQGAMVCCDECENWYHLKCVNIKDAEEVAKTDFFCPCCTPYVHGKYETKEPQILPPTKDLISNLVVLMRSLGIKLEDGTIDIAETLLSTHSVAVQYFKNYYRNFMNEDKYLNGTDVRKLESRMDDFYKECFKIESLNILCDEYITAAIWRWAWECDYVLRLNLFPTIEKQSNALYTTIPVIARLLRRGHFIVRCFDSAKQHSFNEALKEALKNPRVQEIKGIYKKRRLIDVERVSLVIDLTARRYGDIMMELTATFNAAIELRQIIKKKENAFAFKAACTLKGAKSWDDVNMSDLGGMAIITTYPSRRYIEKCLKKGEEWFKKQCNRKKREREEAETKKHEEQMKKQRVEFEPNKHYTTPCENCQQTLKFRLKDKMLAPKIRCSSCDNVQTVTRQKCQDHNS